MRLVDIDNIGIGKANRDLFDIPEYADGWNEAIKIIKSTPTAFDIDKIIEELEKVKSDVHTPADIVWNNAVEMCTSVFNRLINEV